VAVDTKRSGSWEGRKLRLGTKSAKQFGKDLVEKISDGATMHTLIAAYVLRSRDWAVDLIQVSGQRSRIEEAAARGAIRRKCFHEQPGSR
jgi:hypothetical protein